MQSSSSCSSMLLPFMRLRSPFKSYRAYACSFFLDPPYGVLFDKQVVLANRGVSADGWKPHWQVPRDPFHALHVYHMLTIRLEMDLNYGIDKKRYMMNVTMWQRSFAILHIVKWQSYCNLVAKRRGHNNILIPGLKFLKITIPGSFLTRSYDLQRDVAVSS